MSRKAILVAGLPGAGKSVLVKAAKDLKLPVFSMGDIVRDEAIKRNLSVNAENLKAIALELRKKRGPQVIAEMTVKRVMSEAGDSEIVLIDGVRSWDEVEYFSRAFSQIVLISVHAPPKIRFKRLLKRGRKDDPKTWEDFVKRDEVELKLGLGKVIALSDIIFLNYDKNKEDAIKEAKELLIKVINRGSGSQN